MSTKPSKRRARRLRTPAAAVAAGWRELPCSGLERRERAREIVATVLAIPQPPVKPGGALITSRKQLPVAQTGDPISYTRLKERVASERDGITLAANPEAAVKGTRPWPAPVSRRQRPASRRAAACPAGAERRNAESGHAGMAGLDAPMPASNKKESKKKAAARKRMTEALPPPRPGTGGRQASKKVFTEMTATRELREELGEGIPSTHKGARMRRWDVHPDGDGIILCRLSGQELQGGETVMSQIHTVRRMLREEGLKERHIVLTINNSGYSDYEDRPDFQLVTPLILGDCRWVAARGTDRIARETLPRAQFYRLLRDSRTDLYLVRNIWGKVDWDRDQTMLDFQGIMDREEGERIKGRMQQPLVDRFLAEGRGWPAAVKFGFRRGDDKYPEVDPEQWPVVEFIHYAYASCLTLADGSTGQGLRAMKQALKDRGWGLSHEKVRAILKDIIYVTGEYTVTFKGQRIDCRPIPLARPIPLQVYKANQARLSVRARKTAKNPAGTFLLNHVEFVCGKCFDAGVEPETLPGRPSSRLRAYRNPNTGTANYTHCPKTPKAHARASFPAELIDQAVVREILRLASNKVLQKEWADAARPDPAPARPGLTDAQRAELETQLAQALAAREQAEDDFVQRRIAGEPGDERDLKKLTSTYDRTIERLQRRLENADVEVASLTWHKHAADTEQARLRDALEALLADHPSPDLERRAHQAAAIQSILSRVLIYEDPEGGYRLILEGELVPETSSLRLPISPQQSARKALQAHEGQEPAIVIGSHGHSPWTGWHERHVNQDSRPKFSLICL